MLSRPATSGYSAPPDPWLIAADLLDGDEVATADWRGAVPWGRPYEAVLREYRARDRLSRPPAFQDGKARPEQLLPGTLGAAGAVRASTGELIEDDDWLFWLLRCGRGFGKTEVGAQCIIEWARQGLTPLLAAGPTAQDVRDSMVEVGPSSILKVAPSDFRPDYEPSKLRLTFPNGVVVQLRSADEPERFRGTQFVRAWLDELAAWKRLDEAWAQIRLIMRHKSRRGRLKLVITTTPKAHKVVKWLSNHPRCALTVRPSHDNLANLADDFRETIEEVEQTRLGRQEVHGEILDEVEGALWKQADIDEDRITVAEFQRRLAEGDLRLLRVVEGVDPAGGRTETGIVGAGKGSDRHAYVLDDASTAGGPDVWVAALMGSYRDQQADKVVAEINYGGDMVEHTIRGAGHRNVPVKVVRATRGKAIRAEPVAMLYDRHLVHHVGYFPRLEGEMTSWVPDEGMDSPNRMDALVWALTELFELYDDKAKRTAAMPRGAESLLPVAASGGWSSRGANGNGNGKGPPAAIASGRRR